MKLQILKQKFKAFIKDEEGLTTVEYAIAGGLVGAAVITAFTQLGGAVGNQVNEITTAINNT